MKIWNSGTGIILIFWSLFSFWFGRRRRKSRRFEKLSGNLDKSPIKIPLGCIIQRQEFGSPRWMGVSVLGSQCSWLPMHAQRAQNCSNLLNGLSSCPSAETPTPLPLCNQTATNPPQILTRQCPSCISGKSTSVWQEEDPWQIWPP